MESPRDALAAGRLSDAVALQSDAVRRHPGDPAGRLFLFELLALAGRLADARDQLTAVRSADPGWPPTRRRFLRLLQAEHRRTAAGRRPTFLGPAPPHARRRWRAVLAHRAGRPDDAVRWADRADACAPAVAGHVDGREFVGLRDTDDRFGAAFEAFVGGSYVWLPFDAVRRLTLAAAAGPLDAAFRPARAELADGTAMAVVLPLVYPGSHAAADEALAVGADTDWPDAGGPAVGVGARVLLAGDDEVRLADCRQFDLRPDVG